MISGFDKAQRDYERQLPEDPLDDDDGGTTVIWFCCGGIQLFEDDRCPICHEEY